MFDYGDWFEDILKRMASKDALKKMLRSYVPPLQPKKFHQPRCGLRMGNHTVR